MLNIAGIIAKAKKDTRKGSYSVYEEYKLELMTIAKDSVTYNDTLRAIAAALKI